MNKTVAMILQAFQAFSSLGLTQWPGETRNGGPVSQVLRGPLHRGKQENRQVHKVTGIPATETERRGRNICHRKSQ